MDRLLQRFKLCWSGATAIEYSLIAGFVGLAIVTAAATLGNEVAGIFTQIAVFFQGL